MVGWWLIPNVTVFVNILDGSGFNCYWCVHVSLCVIGSVQGWLGCWSYVCVADCVIQLLLRLIYGWCMAGSCLAHICVYVL